MAPNRFNVHLPTSSGARVRRRGIYFTGGGYSVTLRIPSASRHRRAAAEDLWRKCQSGGDCIDDVRRKYTHTTTADKILQIGSAGVYLGGLTIGTGEGVAEAGGAGGVPWPDIYSNKPDTGSFIPHEKPFSLPGADIPVRVDVPRGEPAPAAPVIPEPVDSGNTFMNPAFEDDVMISVSSNDNVVITDPTPASGPLPVPEPDTLEIPEESRTRGDTFVPRNEELATDYEATAVPTPENPFLPQRLSEPDMSGPFVQLELVDLAPSGAIDPAVEQSTWFGSDAYDDDIPLLSTPRRGGQGPRARARTVEFANPAFEPDYVQSIFDRELEKETNVLKTLLSGKGSPGGTVSVVQDVTRPGMTLRSGLNVPFTTRYVGDLSPITLPGEPSVIEMRSFEPTGSGDTFIHDLGMAESGLSHSSTVAWDGSPIDVTGIIDFPNLEGGFTDIPLDDPFPEMEIIDDDGNVTNSASTSIDLGQAVRTVSHSSVSFVRGRGTHGRTAGGMQPIGPAPGTAVPFFPIFPGNPGIPIAYYDNLDPSLIWWYLRKRRRLQHLFYR